MLCVTSAEKWKSCLCLSALTLLVLWSQAGISQVRSNQRATNVRGITAFPAPPEGFAPLTASEEQLAEFGFPPRPDPSASPRHYATWSKAVLAAHTRIIPVLEETNRYHGPARWKQAVQSNEDNDLESYNWSGYVNLIGATRFGSTSFYAIAAEFVVPVASTAFGTCSGTPDYASSWVGIDGYNSSDVLQAGIEFDVVCCGGAIATLYAPWIEWFPAAEVRISNLPIAPGDDYYVEVWNTSATTGYAYFVNENTNKAVTVSFSPPAGSKLIGNSAEWITERPQSDGQATTLTNYIAEPYWGAYGLSHSNRGFDPGSSNAIDMYDDNGIEISYPTLMGNTAFLVQDINSAR
jgi:hypothetical protein